jgi:hypothetical protein
VTDQTLLLRQIHPSFIDRDRVTSQAFRPTEKDRGKLSVYDGDLISAEGSWKHYTARVLKSAGVLAVTVGECAAEQLPTGSIRISSPSTLTSIFAAIPSMKSKGRPSDSRQSR